MPGSRPSNIKEQARAAASDAGFNSADPDLINAWTDALRALPAGPVAESDVLAWVEGPLRQFFPFEKFLGVYGVLSGERIEMRSLIWSGHTPEAIANLGSTFDIKTRTYFEWWVVNRRPFIADMTSQENETGDRVFASKHEVEEFKRNAVNVYAAHGVIDPFIPAGTYFSFTEVPRTQPKRTLAALDLIAPVLHTLYLRTKPTERSPVDLSVLTDRQRDLVALALEGMADKAIAVRLAISDHTVGNHFRAIYAKLGISKRSQLIALLK